MCASRIIIFLTFFGFYLRDVLSLKDVVLDIEPRVVQRGEQSTLRCSYDMEGAPLYTVKFYRGNHEFYRYTPSEQPFTKIFPFTGVHVDLEQSNEHQVVLRKVGFNLSGNFSCEVTTEAPNFSTKVVSKDMLVVVLPESPPIITTDKFVYAVGDVLRANCTSSPSKPAATLRFILNNIVICDKCEPRKRQKQDLWETEISVQLPLFPSHFNNGRLILRCVAHVTDLYHQDTELRLDNTRDPVPAKVTSPSCAAYFNFSFFLMIFGLCSVITKMC